ncbi:MAG: radical SAM protein [Planctomycetota bacterium]
MGDERAPLVEMFWSVQGEGRWVGRPMAFVRVATCPLRCTYCDTVTSYKAPAVLPVRCDSGEELQEPNPVAAARADELLQRLMPVGSGRAVSVTGGEPLVAPAFVHALGARLRARGDRLHLETAAIDPGALARCVAEVDHLSADYKLPETIGGADHGEAHAACCALALERGATVDVKIVLTPGAAERSLVRALERLRPLRERVLLVLQPVTPCLDEPAPVPPAQLRRAIALAHERGFDLRVLPQVHKALQVP